MDQTSWLGAASCRWSRGGTDWLALRLNYALGASIAELSERYGIGVWAIRSRVQRECWRRNLSDIEILEIGMRVALVEGLAALERGDLNEAGARFRVLRSMRALAREEVKVSGGGEMNGENRDSEKSRSVVEDVHGRLDRLLESYERKTKHRDVEGDVEQSGHGESGA